MSIRRLLTLLLHGPEDGRLVIDHWDQRRFEPDPEPPRGTPRWEIEQAWIARLAAIPRDPEAIAEREQRLAAIQRRLWWAGQ